MRWQIIAEITLLRRNQVVEETILLEEIWWNGTKEQEVIKELEKEDRIVYMDRRIYVLNNQKIRKKILQENYELADIGHLG